MPVRYSNPEGHHDPAGRYSHVAVSGPGRFAFISGQLALDGDGDLVGDGEPGEQYRQCLRNVMSIVESLGGDASQIVELRTFVVGEKNLPDLRAARESEYSRLFGDGPFPPSTLLVVAGLAAPQFLVEVAATAVLAE